MDMTILLHDGLCWTTRLAICHVLFHNTTRRVEPVEITRGYPLKGAMSPAVGQHSVLHILLL